MSLLLCVKVSIVQGSFGGFYQHVVELSKTLGIFIDNILNLVQAKFGMQEKMSDGDTENFCISQI